MGWYIFFGDFSIGVFPCNYLILKQNPNKVLLVYQQPTFVPLVSFVFKIFYAVQSTYNPIRLIKIIVAILIQRTIRRPRSVTM